MGQRAENTTHEEISEKGKEERVKANEKEVIDTLSILIGTFYWIGYLHQSQKNGMKPGVSIPKEVASTEHNKHKERSDP